MDAPGGGGSFRITIAWTLTLAMIGTIIGSSAFSVFRDVERLGHRSRALEALGQQRCLIAEAEIAIERVCDPAHDQDTNELARIAADLIESRRSLLQRSEFETGEHPLRASQALAQSLYAVVDGGPERWQAEEAAGTFARARTETNVLHETMRQALEAQRETLVGRQKAWLVTGLFVVVISGIFVFLPMDLRLRVESRAARESTRSLLDKNARLEQARKQAEAHEERERHRSRAILSVTEDLELERVRLRAEVEEHQNTEAQLQVINQELQELLYAVSHDLKSPLVTLTGFSARIQKHLQEGQLDRASDASERIHRAAQTLSDLIDELLSLNRIGRASLDLEPVDAHAVAREVIDTLAGPILERSVKVEIAGTLPTVVTDRNLLMQVLMNLLSNAIQHGCLEPGARIVVGADVEEQDTRIWVQDYGEGVPEDQQARIFTVFQRLKRTGSGSGLGLAIVKKAMNTLGGEAWVISRPSRGARFGITLPRASCSVEEYA